jgi:fructoselysine and glucoselysine-specific PTS system IIB component
MIKFCRIDDKLLHGQIVMAWTRYVGAEHIVVVNDEAATDQFKKMTLGLAKPAGVGLSVFTVEDAIKKLGAGTKKIIMVILGNTNDALNLINGVSEIKEINYGGIRQKENSKKFGDAVFLDEKDIENSKKILEKGVNINIQQLPTIPAVDIKTLL